MKKLNNLLKKENGVTTVEWLIIIAAVAVLATLAVSVISPRVNTLINKAADQISDTDTPLEEEEI